MPVACDAQVGDIAADPVVGRILTVDREGERALARADDLDVQCLPNRQATIGVDPEVTGVMGDDDPLSGRRHGVPASQRQQDAAGQRQPEYGGGHRASYATRAPHSPRL